MIILFSALLLFVNGSSAPYKYRVTCKTSKNSNSCYWTHGRLYLANGTPAFRISIKDSKRILGILSGSDAKDPLDNENPEFPGNVSTKFDPLNNQIIADFEVCPLEPEKPRTMQLVCIESAWNIVVDKSKTK